MFIESSNPVAMKAVMQAILAALSARPAAALWVTPNIHLFVNNIQANSDNVLSDFTEATFAGYALAALPALSAPVRLGNGSQAVLASVVFIGGAIVAPGQTAFGYYITDTTNAILYAAETFLVPQPFAVAGDFLELAFAMPEPGPRQTGES